VSCRSYAKFADALKASKDLLSKPYPEANKVEFKATSASGPVFTFEALVGEAPAPKKGLAIPGLLFKGEGAVHGGLKVDKAAVDTNGEIVAEISLAGTVKDAKFSLKARDSTRAKVPADYDAVAVSFGVEHKSEYATATADVDAIKQKLDFTLLGGYKGALLGASIGGGKVVSEEGKEKAKVVKYQVIDYNALLGYKAGDITVGLTGEKNFKSAVLGFHQAVSKELAIAASAKVTPAVAEAPKAEAPKADDKAAAVAAAGETPKPKAEGSVEVSAGFTYKANADTVLAVKFTTDAKQKRTVDLSYAQQLSSLAKLTVGANIDAANIAKADHKIAVSLALSA